MRDNFRDADAEEVTQAVLPRTPNALPNSPLWTASGDEDAGYLGIAVATAGDVNGDGFADVIAGAQSHDAGVAGSNRGRAYVFHGSATGPALTPSWTGSGDENGALFGCAVATAGDVNGDGYSDVIVGSYRHDTAGGVDAGRAYVYLGSASGLAETPVWTGSGDEASARYGLSVSTAGDTNGDGYSDIVVGASLHDAGVAASNRGRAYVYLGSSGGPSGTPVRTYSGDENSAYLGIAVATAGDVDGDGYSDVLVGASAHDAGGASGANRGRAYVYLGSASGPQSTLNWVASGDQDGASFGAAVSTAGDVDGDGYSDILVGAPLHDAGGTDRGRAYLFRGSDLGTLAAASWEASGDENGAGFGTALATSGDVDGDGYADVAAGAPFHDGGGASDANRGRAYLYLGGASGLATVAVWSASGDEDNANFGQALFTAGDADGDGFSDLVVGAPNHDAGGALNANRGRAYLFPGAGSTSVTFGWSGEGNVAYAWFGEALASAGDVNGDGRADVIVGAPQYDNSYTREGAAFLFLGTGSGLEAVPSWSVYGGVANAYCGSAVAGAGDVNGDGYDDVLVASYLFTNGQTNEGRVWLFHGSVSGLSTTPAWTIEGNATSATFGSSVAGAGDVNGDGYADVIIGSPGYNGGSSLEGRALLYLGSPLGLATTSAWTVEGEQAVARLGYSVAGAGDVNGDGYSDVVVGASGYDNGEVDEGMALLYLGSATGLGAATWSAEGNQAEVSFGASVAGAGDVDGDGFSDVVVCAPYYDNGHTDEGRVSLFRGSAGGLLTTASWTAEADRASAGFGWGLDSAGDVNGDGYSDLVIGAYGFSGGSAFLYTGSASGLGATPSWSTTLGSYFGSDAAGAGDVDGDGYSDIVVGARYDSNGEFNEGMAYLYLGNEGPGVAFLPKQLRPDGSAPVALLGRAPSGDFILQAWARTAMGRGDVKLEWQVTPLGTAFPTAASSMSRSTTWLDTGVGGTSIAGEEVIGGSEGPYCWRLRALYRASTNPFQRHGAWKTPAGNGRRETDLRKTAPCYTPDLEVSLLAGVKSGADYTLVFLDSNEAWRRTGWNIRRSTSPSAAPTGWPLVGWNVPDGIPGTPDQFDWTDTGGNPAPGGVWYYQVATYNLNCPAEGPY